jgi:tRNA modification GTPase
MTEDTIAAISTPIGEGGIAIVRISGPHAFAVADAIFISKRGRPSTFPTHTIHFGRIGQNGNSVDQVMLTVMRAPRTHTGENVVEINCHGGTVTARTILALCLQQGARLAAPGEFTKRAFLNGRLDLTQAEAVMDLIHAKTQRAQTVAVHALEGHLSRQLEQARQCLLNIVAHIEAHIDFPEEGIDTGTRDQWLNQTREVLADLQATLATAAEGRVLRQGISIAIVGRPNVGKSSLLNALLGEERAIVTAIPGTTRDTIEETASINGIPVRLTDTAGLRKPRGTVEQLGISRSRKTIETADLILHVLDASRPSASFDRQTFVKPTIHVLNKCDLPARLSNPPSDAIRISALRGDGIPELRDRIAVAAGMTPHAKSEMDCFVNERQADVLRRATESLTVATGRLAAGDDIELVSQELRVALNAIGEITGKTATEDLLDSIFSQFCIGK